MDLGFSCIYVGMGGRGGDAVTNPKEGRGGGGGGRKVRVKAALAPPLLLIFQLPQNWLQELAETNRAYWAQFGWAKTYFLSNKNE